LQIIEERLGATPGQERQLGSHGQRQSSDLPHEPTHGYGDSFVHDHRMGQHNRASGQNIYEIQAFRRLILLEPATIFLGMCDTSTQLSHAGLRHLDKSSCCRRRDRHQLVVHGDWAGFGALLSVVPCRPRPPKNTLGSSHDHNEFLHLTYPDHDLKPGGESFQAFISPSLSL